MFTHVSTEQLQQMAAKVGREVSRRYPGTEPDDIASEALARVYSRLDRLMDKEPGYLYKALRKGAIAYAAEQRYRYVVGTSQYIYTPAEVRVLLEHCYYDPAAWSVPTGRDDWLSAEIDGQSIGVALMDMRAAMERIKPEHQRTLEKAFNDGENIHHEKVSRAVEALVRALNRHINRRGDREGPGARKAMSNAQAQYRTRAETGHEGRRREVDAVHELQKLRRQEPNDPPGTHFDWDKYSR